MTLRFPGPGLSRSATLLSGVNIVCAAIGVMQGLLVLRMLGAELFGAAAVLTAVGSVAANLIDVRLPDLLSKLYYDEHAASPERGFAYRAAILRFGLRFYAIAGAAIAIVTGILLVALAGRLTGSDVPASAFWLVAAAQGLSYLGSFFIFIQRFTVSSCRMAVLQLVSAAINAAAMLGAVAGSHTVAAYAAGLCASALGITVVNAAFSVAAYRSSGISLLTLRRGTEGPRLDRGVILKFIAAGNLLGYVKLLHRSADVLLVAAFCGDRETGIYKLARSIADSLHAASEPLARIYQPRLLALLQQRDFAGYRAIAQSLTTTWAIFTAIAIAAEITLLPRMAPLLNVPDGGVLAMSVAILTVPFLFTAGLQSWIWPAFVSAGRMGRCTVWGVAGALAQYTVGPALALVTGDGAAVWFSLGFLAFYVFSVLPLWRELRQDSRWASPVVETVLAR